MSLIEPRRCLRPTDDSWPLLLREIPDPPEVLEISGRLEALAAPCVAIVGTRRATHRGLAVARGLGLQAALHGWTVVSGFALGIDAAAHSGALEGGGGTVAVMATGIDLTYPRRHGDLRRRLELTGCCLTEHPPGTPPLRHHFPRRNRLIAGLVRGVIVVEAPVRSGAMITARLAADFNREVMAVPGPVDLETSRGCHRLLRDGAALIESWSDVVEALGDAHRESDPARLLSSPPAGSPAGWILDRIDLAGVRRDELRGLWPGTEETWQQGLLALETAGLILRLPEGRLARRLWSA